MKTNKPRHSKQFCDPGWVFRMKLAKRQEHLDRGEEVPRWLADLEQAEPGEQMKLFTEGETDA